MKRWTQWMIVGGAAASLFGMVLPTRANAKSITFQDGLNDYAGTDDTHLYGGPNQAYNAGAAASMQAGFNSSGENERRIILRFDLSSLAGQYNSIQSATLTLTGTGSGADEDPDFTLSLYQIADANADWTEGDNGFAVATAGEGESTWRAKHDGMGLNNIPWAGDKGLYEAGTDYLTPTLDSVVYKGTDTNGALYHFDIDATVIQHWITDTNAGLLLISNTASEPGYAQFYTSNYSTVAYRPQLEVKYTPIPEPTAGLLLMGGGVVMLVRRRKPLD